MPFHDEPKPKKKSLPLWVEALDLLQSKSASKLLDPYREERDDDDSPTSMAITILKVAHAAVADDDDDDDSDWNWSPRSLAESERLYGSKCRSRARATMRAARIFWQGALTAELERLYGNEPERRCVYRWWVWRGCFLCKAR